MRAPEKVSCRAGEADRRTVVQIIDMRGHDCGHVTTRVFKKETRVRCPDSAAARISCGSRGGVSRLGSIAPVRRPGVRGRGVRSARQCCLE